MTIADAPPDWSTHAADVTCPLCDYNLHGLTEPRCPECGFAFTWAELLDAKRDRHPWLFEHAVPGPRRRRAFWKTYVRTSAPRWFWRALTPANTVRRGPLVRYWVITTLLLSGVIVGPLVVQAERLAMEYQAARARLTPVPGAPGMFQQPSPLSNPFASNWWPPRRPGTIQPPTPLSSPFARRGPPPRPPLLPTAAVNAALPPVYSPKFALRVADAYLRRTGGAFVAVVVVAAGWPWLTTATLLVFRTSMRRAKTNGDHVLRAAIYSCDFGLLITGLAVAMFWPMIDRGRTVRGRDVVELAAILAVLTAGVSVVVTTYRLSFAYGRYLRFHLPLATVLASQVIAFLALLAVAVNVAQAW